MNTFGLAESVSSWYGMTVMLVIGGMSVHLVTVIILRILFFRRIRVDSAKVVGEVRQALTGRDAKALTDLKSPQPGAAPIRVMIGQALSNLGFSEADLNALLALARKRQKARLERGLSVFATLSTIAPFVGLLGTVLGIVESFYNLSQTGAAGPNVVGSGVAAALWATAAGLCVAIPSVIAYNLFSHKVKDLLLDMDVACGEFLLLVKQDRNGSQENGRQKVLAAKGA